jgi:phytoene desaturase
MQKKAIIIGSGVAGLSCAIRLAVQGYAVKVFEKNSCPGGKIAILKKENYQFDAGPSLFTQPQNIEELFTLAGEPMAEYFSYQKIPIVCKYFYEDTKVINAYSDTNLFAKEIQEQLGEKSKTIIGYLKKSENLYNHIGSIFLNHSLHKRKTWLHKRIFKALQFAKPIYLFKTLHHYNSTQFSNPDTVQLFNRYATYNGSNPYKAPAMLSLIPQLEYNQGVFYPKGGMISIANALYKLALKKGVELNFNAPVQRIINTSGKVKGIVVNNKNIVADIVVSNMDVYFTYKNLLLDEIKAKKILQQERSSSALIFYWGIKKEFKQLELHNIFFTKNYQAEFEHIFLKRDLYPDPTIYINITAKIEQGHALPGCENWFVMINVPANKNQDWELLKAQAKENILKKLNNILQTDIESLIEVEEILDPVLIEEQTASFMGSLYGTSSNSTFAAFFRHPNFTKKIKGLYFCGGSVHPGGGIPLCFKSAKIVSELIQHDYK